VRFGVDTGGTFTDCVASDGTVTKVPSRPDDPASAVAAALSTTPRREVGVLAHGTTVATNAVLEGRGAPVVLVTDVGLEDVVEVARQDRPSLYDQFADRPPPLVPRDRRIGVRGRRGASGVVLELLDVDALDAVTVAPGEVVAVVRLHSDLDPSDEVAIATRLRARGLDVTCSHEVSPEMREYERTVTTVVDAMLRPLCRDYLRALLPLADEVYVLTSAAGLVPVGAAADRPARLLVSGPAGGVRSAAALAALHGLSGAVSFDMGGTSTDVCLIEGGVPEAAPSLVVGGYPVRLPALAVHTIGAGGGSIASIDPGGALSVGPRSAGAQPGPACYGRGGGDATVTDADLVLGRIDPDAGFPGIGRLDRSAAAHALDGPGLSASEVIDVVDAAMAEAVRAVTVARGVDPAGLALIAFGGAGPLHACAIAEILGMPTVVVPARAGAFSAVGLLTAPRQCDLVRSWPTPTRHDGLGEALESLAAEALSALDGPGDVTTAVDARYRGQGHELTVPCPSGAFDLAAFHVLHQRRNGYARPDDVVEVIALRSSAVRPSPISLEDLAPPAQRRETVTGPATIVEADCSIWVADGWVAAPRPDGSLFLTRR
jgi:N-methylhydantoinase A/oxoprolinase/acetone carboxylase beta subunit